MYGARREPFDSESDLAYYGSNQGIPPPVMPDLVEPSWAPNNMFRPDEIPHLFFLSKKRLLLVVIHLKIYIVQCLSQRRS